MPDSQPPRLRRIDSFPVQQPGGEVTFALRDPEGFAGSIVVPYPAAVLASFMDGQRNIAEIQAAFQKKFGQEVDRADVEHLIAQLDERLFLDSDRFRAVWKTEVERYLNGQVRPAAHAGGAYPADPVALQTMLSGLFTDKKGPGALAVCESADGEQQPTGKPELVGVLSPHIDFHRGGPAFAWAYKRFIPENPADLFVIFGTAHNPLNSLFSVTRKHFETPLGTVETDRPFAAKLTATLAKTPGGQELNLGADELAHRQEHSIEFQVLFLKYLLGDRPFKVLPVLVGSFHEFVESGTSPGDSPQVQAFVSAMKQAAASYSGRICYISGGDLAHIGQRFGDPKFLDKARLTEQAASDHQLLAAAGGADAEGFFRHVAAEHDRSRICGLSPTYTMLEVMKPERGELLRYDQAVELDGTSCVSFASMAFYKDGSPG